MHCRHQILRMHLSNFTHPKKAINYCVKMHALITCRWRKSVNYSEEYWDYKESVDCASVMFEVSSTDR